MDKEIKLVTKTCPIEKLQDQIASLENSTKAVNPQPLLKRN